MRARPLTAFLVVVLATAVAHLGSLRGGFHFDDDHTILLNRDNLQDPSSVIRFFGDPRIYSGLPDNGMYRPVTYASTVWDARFAAWNGESPDPVPFHVTNLLVHALAAGVLLLLLRRLLREVLPGDSGEGARYACADGAALLGALWFGLHPAHSEVVNYVSARSESLAGLFFLLALWLHHRAWTDGLPLPRRLGWIVLALAAAALSHGAKETGALLFVVAGSVEIWGRREGGGWRGALRRLPRALPFLALLVLYLVLRHEAMGVAVGGIAGRPEVAGDGQDPFTAGGRTLAAHWLTQCRVLVEYARLLLFPVDLSPDHFVSVVKNPLHGPTLLALALLGAAGALVVRAALRGGRLLPLSSAWAACAIAPSVLIPLNVIMNEHRMYLPSTGLALLFGVAAARVVAELARRGKGPLATALLGVMFTSFVAIDVSRAADWSRPVVLWGKAVVAEPGSWRAHHHLGVTFLREAGRLRDEADGDGSLDDAAREELRERSTEFARGALARFRAAQAIHPVAFATRLNLGTALLDLARLRNRGGHPDEVPRFTEEYEESLHWFTEAEKASPGSGRAQYYRATALAELGRVEEALAEFTRMQKGDPTRGHLYNFALADLHRRLGHYDEALAWLDREAERDPATKPSVALKKSEVLVQAGRFDDADVQLRQAFAVLGGDDPVMLVYMARMLAASGRPLYVPQVRTFWERAKTLGYRPGPKDRAIRQALGE